MKKKETVDDEAIKMASKTQRAGEKMDFPEAEDPAEYKFRKKLKASVFGVFGKRKKKEAREDREKTKKIAELISKRDIDNAKGN